METGLRLLMRDGAVQIVFRPRLSGQHYAELASLVDGPSTKDELCESIRNWAKQHGLEVVVCDDAI